MTQKVFMESMIIGNIPYYVIRKESYERTIEGLAFFKAKCAELEATIADVLSALDAIDHEGPRLAALRVVSERNEAMAQVVALTLETRGGRKKPICTPDDPLGLRYEILLQTEEALENANARISELEATESRLREALEQIAENPDNEVLCRVFARAALEKP